jgi:hypothetical protein
MRYGTWKVRSLYRVGASSQRWTQGIDGVDWIRLTQDRVRWRAFVNTIMNLRVP